MKKSSKALKSQSISALICAPGPDFFFLRSGAGWQIKENQNRLAPGRLRPGKVYSLPKSDNGFCLIYYFCVGARSQMSPGAQRVSSRPWLAKREICQRTIFLGALCKIAIAANIYRFWAPCPLHITGLLSSWQGPTPLWVSGLNFKVIQSGLESI